MGYVKLIFFFLLIQGLSFSLFSQKKDTVAFKPHGEVIARSFFDYSTDFSGKSAFDITRAFLGYEYTMLPTLKGQVILDGAAGSTKDDRLEIYLRNAFVNWSDKGFSINFGLISLLQFSMQEDYWTYRYALRSFQDLNKMAPSVDLGVTAEYRFNWYIAADLSLTNGPGYKDVKKTDSKRYALGLTLNPFTNTVFRVYTDIMNESTELRDDLPENVMEADIDFENQYTLSLFAGYQNQKVSAGAEFNKVFNKGFVKHKDYYGYSFYSSYKFKPKWSVYVRYDLADSSSPKAFISPWSDLDGQLMMAGIEFIPLKQIRISPNFQNVNPSVGESEQYLFINVEFNL